MTDYKKFLIYIGTTLAIVLSFPGRIAYGIFALLHFNVSVVLLTLMFYAINLLNVKFLRLGICSLELVALTILYKQLLVIFCPVAALTIGFSFYLPAVSAVVITIFNLRIKNSIKESCLDKLKKSLSISAFCLYIVICHFLNYFSISALLIFLVAVFSNSVSRNFKIRLANAEMVRFQSTP